VFSAHIDLYWEIAYTPGADILLYPDQTVSSPLGPIVNAPWEMSTNPMATMTNNQDGEFINLAVSFISPSFGNLLSLTNL
jgi:hypothetical protein